MKGRNCKTNPNSVCYVCGQYIVEKITCVITESLKFAYLHYFGFAVGNQCKLETRNEWTGGEKSYLPYNTPMLWREPKNHNLDCCFCLTNVFGISSKSKHKLKYADISSVTKPVIR